MVKIEVNEKPPAKDGGMAIANPQHPHFPRVVALRAAVNQQVTARQRFEDGVPLRLQMTYHRPNDENSDGLNLINGVADIIQRRGHLNQPWAIDDDKNIKAFTYCEYAAETPSYTIAIERYDAVFDFDCGGPFAPEVEFDLKNAITSLESARGELERGSAEIHSDEERFGIHQLIGRIDGIIDGVQKFKDEYFSQAE